MEKKPRQTFSISWAELGQRRMKPKVEKSITNFILKMFIQGWELRFAVLAFGRMRQEDCEFQTRLGYRRRHHLQHILLVFIPLQANACIGRAPFDVSSVYVLRTGNTCVILCTTAFPLSTRILAATLLLSIAAEKLTLLAWYRRGSMQCIVDGFCQWPRFVLSTKLPKK